MLGLKLDSSPADSVIGLLPSTGSDPRRSKDQYAKFGLTAKMRVSDTVLKYGALLLICRCSNTMMAVYCQTHVRCAMLVSQEIRDLKFMASRR